MSKEINLQDVFSEILKKWWIVAICVVIFGALFFVYSEYMIEEQYTSYGSIYVNNKAQQVLSSYENENNTANIYDLTAAEKLVDTYMAILSSNNFFEIMKENEGFDYSLSKMKRSISYANVEETGIIQVYVQLSSPIEAKQLCEAVLNNANYAIMNIIEVGSVKTIDNATLPTAPSYPSVAKNTLIGMIFGAILACAIIFLINYFDVRIKTANNIESKYDLLVLGTIPDMLTNHSENAGEHL